MKLTKKQLQNLLIEQVLFSEGLRYHVENSIPLYDCIYRPGSKGFFSLISESRTMYNNGFLRVDEDELDMINSDMGRFANYGNREVALDFPISQEADDMMMLNSQGFHKSEEMMTRVFNNEFGNEIEVEVRGSHYDDFMDGEKPYEGVFIRITGPDSESSQVMTKMEAETLLELLSSYFNEDLPHLNEGIFSWLTGGPKLSPEQKREKEFLDFHNIPVVDAKARIAYLKRLFSDPRQQRAWLNEYNQIWKPNHIRKLLEKRIEKIRQRKLVSKMSDENDAMIDQLNDLINQLEIAKLSSDIRTIERIENQINQLGIMLNERKKRKRRRKKKPKSKKSGSYYNGRKVKLNKPARNSGSGGKFVVYVRNQKTGNIKRITFGQRGMTTGLRSAKRSKSFENRHRCRQKTDKLAPGYWACRIGRYPAVSGAPYRTWW